MKTKLVSSTVKTSAIKRSAVKLVIIASFALLVSGFAMAQKEGTTAPHVGEVKYPINHVKLPFKFAPGVAMANDVIGYKLSLIQGDINAAQGRINQRNARNKQLAKLKDTEQQIESNNHLNESDQSTIDQLKGEQKDLKDPKTANRKKMDICIANFEQHKRAAEADLKEVNDALKGPGGKGLKTKAQLNAEKAADQKDIDHLDKAIGEAQRLR